MKDQLSSLPPHQYHTFEPQCVRENPWFFYGEELQISEHEKRALDDQRRSYFRSVIQACMNEHRPDMVIPPMDIII